MKKKIITFLTFCFAWQTNAQTPNTIVNDNSSWTTLSYVAGYDAIHQKEVLWSVGTQYVYFNGDSIVASVSYKKAFSCNDRLCENIKYEGLIREHEKKTYFIPANSEKEYLLYDFSLEEGTSFEYRDFRSQESAILYVSSVDFVEINGSAKKCIQIKTAPYVEWEILDTWIEEIGSLYGILYPCLRLFFGGGVKELLCHYQNNELIYKNPVYSECYYNNPDDIVSVQTIVTDDCSIYPNPVDDIINISCSNNMISRIEIFDDLGRQVFNQTGDETISISSFSKGLYLLKIYNTNEQVSVFKIIKN